MFPQTALGQLAFLQIEYRIRIQWSEDLNEQESAQ